MTAQTQTKERQWSRQQRPSIRYANAQTRCAQLTKLNSVMHTVHPVVQNKRTDATIPATSVSNNVCNTQEVGNEKDK